MAVSLDRFTVSSPHLVTLSKEGVTMSQTTDAAPETPPANDPFYYGWRYVTRVRRENGEEWEEVVQVPLTYNDMLHPEEGDIVTHTPLHHRICAYLVAVIEAWARNQPDLVVVLPDVRIEWDIPELQAHGPDVAVIFGARERQNWGTFSVAQEGVRPALIIEVTSPKTRRGDLVDKVDEYAIAGVPLYVIVDFTQRRGTSVARLLGYQLVNDVYEVLAPNEDGWLWLAPIRHWIAIENERIVCYDQAGQALPDYSDLAEARSAAEARAAEAEAAAHTEARARAEAEARLRELEAELRRLRGET
jgi:Uma2 family endonuclease